MPRLALLAALALAFPHPAARAQDAAPASPATPQAVPVSVARAGRQDVPIYLSGLGSVQALNSVLVRSRVDGTLIKVPVREGQTVKQGDLIAVIDPRPYQAVLDQAMAKKQQDEADLENAKRDLQRYTALARQDFASRQQLETQQAAVARFTAEIAGDVATVEAAQLNLSFCYITSPITGRVGLRQVDPGNLIHAADPGGIVTITQMQPIAATFTLPQQDLPRITAAMRGGPLAVQALNGEGGQLLARGTLLTLDNTIDPSSGTIKLKAEFPNTDMTLWPGQFITAQLHLETLANVLAVPSVAVQHGPAGLYVYSVSADSTVRRAPVKVMVDTGSIAVIASGLEDGATVVTSGQSRLQDGTHVAPRSSDTANGQSVDRAA